MNTKELTDAEKTKIAIQPDFIPDVKVLKPDALVVRSQSSVTLKKDSKGKAVWEIKVYSDNPQAAADEALKLHKKFEEEFGEG